MKPITREKANKVVRRLRKSRREAWVKHDEVLLKYLRMKDELANALWREKHYLMDFYHLKGLSPSDFDKMKEMRIDESFRNRERERLQNQITSYINKNNVLWNKMMKLPGGLEAARAGHSV